MTEISRFIDVRQQAANGKVVKYQARLDYDTLSPFEVKVVFLPPFQESVTWRVGRESLVAATYLEAPPEIGDVRMYSCTPGEVIHFECYGEYEGTPWQADMHFEYEQISAFLKDIQETLPAILMETPERVIDEFIAEVLGGSDE